MGAVTSRVTIKKKQSNQRKHKILLLLLFQNKKDTDLYLGVTALGLNIYEKDNKLAPKTTFPWSEIKHISFDDKKFIIKFVDKNVNNFIFFSPKGMNKLVSTHLI